jgi:hypothetical protein
MLPLESQLSRYFFSIRHALRMIKTVRQVGEHNDPGLMMIVRDESLKTILSLPFLAACA